MAQIKKVTKITVVEGDRRGHYGYWVYYADKYSQIGLHTTRTRGRKRYYGMNELLPMTIVNFLLEAECSETNYETWCNETKKYEDFTKEEQI